MELIPPSSRFEGSYRSLIAELSARREPFIPFPLAFPHDDFPALLAKLAEHAEGRGIPSGFVPNSTYWLVDGAEILGVSNIRHRLTPALRLEGGNIGYGVRPSARRKGVGTELLRQTLAAAKRHDLPKVVLTCGKPNLGSVKVILANGGRLQSEEFVATRNEVVQRYWIDLADSAAFREATADDSPGIAGVHIASWRAAYAGLLPADFLASLNVEKRAEGWRKILADPSGTSYVAASEAGLLGFVHVCPSRDEDEPAGRVGEVTAIYLSPDAWDQGWGSKLLDRGLAKLSAIGMQEATLWVLERNDRACRFYERKQFAPDGKAKVHHTGLKEVRYRRALSTLKA